LGFISLPLRRTVSTPRDTKFVRLELGAFYKSARNLTFYETNKIKGSDLKLEIDNLTVAYHNNGRAILALDKVDLTMETGHVTALVGESGSGKTTLGKTIMGLLPDNAGISGCVKLDERDIIGLNEAAMNQIRWSKVAMVFQNQAANLNPAHRIVDQVAEPLIQHRRINVSAARGCAGEALERMGLLRDQAVRFPHELSGGEIQRAMLAMALIMEPELLILDEPTSALDAMTKAFVADVICGVKKNGTSVLLITHDLDLARRLGDELVVLYLGSVMEIMPAKELLLNPLHPYTLALVRSYPGMKALRDLGGIRGDAFYRISHSHLQMDEEERPHTHVLGPEAFHEDRHAAPGGCLFQPRCTQSEEGCLKNDVPVMNLGGHSVRCLRGGIVNRMELKDVSRKYGKVTALSHANLELRAGEVFSIVGETGSGKSTLAMIAAGVLMPDKGRRIFENMDMDRWPVRGSKSLAGRIGVIYQNPAEAVSHRLSVFDIVAEPLRIQGKGHDKGEIDERVKRALKDVRLSSEPGFITRYPHELNMGAIQRVCIARALILEPSLLVADEPTSFLDPSVQAKVLKLLMDLQTEKGLTMLFVTHDIGLARKISDRIGVMLAGRIVEVGPSSQVLCNPLHPYTGLLTKSAAGHVDSAFQIPDESSSGCCPFARRCSLAESNCFSELPPQVCLDGGYHRALCFRPQIEDYSDKLDKVPSLNGFET